MDHKRRVIVGFVRAVTYVVTVVVLSGTRDVTGLDLDCINSFKDRITCYLDREECAEYSLTIRGVYNNDRTNCSLQQCDGGRCCCSVKLTTLIGESHNVTVWRGGRRGMSQIFDVQGSMKPETPTIISVKESKGAIEILWQINMTGMIRQYLSTNLTYYKKGGMKKESKIVGNTSVKGQYYHEIRGENLEKSTTYVVSLRSMLTFDGKTGRLSDSSPEWEFKTPASSDSLLLAIIISLSIAAVILSGAIYFCFVRLKTKWWETIGKCPNPKLDILHSNEQEVLKPVPSIISSISVDPLILDDSKPWSRMSPMDSSSGSLQQSSGISTGSSCLSYVNTEPADIKAGVQDALCQIFPNISPISQLMSTPLIEVNQDSGLPSAPVSPHGGTSCGSAGIVNKTYSILLPQLSVTDSLAAETGTEMLSDSAYHPSEMDVVDHERQPFSLALPLGVSSFMPTDMSYQQCKQEPGRFSEESEESALPSVSSASAAGGPSDGESGADETKLDGVSCENVLCDNEMGQAPVKSQSLLLVDDEYRAFGNLVGCPDALLPEQKSAQPVQHEYGCQEESRSEIQQNLQSAAAPGFSDHDPSGQSPFVSFWPANQSTSVIVDSDYKSL